MKQDTCVIVPSVKAPLPFACSNGDDKFLTNIAWNGSSRNAESSSCRSGGSLSSSAATNAGTDLPSSGGVGGGGGGAGGGGGGSNGDSSASSPHVLNENMVGVSAIGSHAVYVHVNPGETLSVRVGNDIQHIPGPATVRMVSSHNSAPPMALPLHVPPGHIVQQVIDEAGVLRHLILSPQTPIVAGAFPCMNIANGTMSPNVQFMPMQNGHHDGLTPSPVPPSQASPSSFFPPLPLLTDPHHVCQLHINHEDSASFSGGTKVRLPRGYEKRRRDVYSDLRTTNDEAEPADVGLLIDDNTSATTSGTEDEEFAKIAEMLSGIKSPQVCEIGTREALVTWQPFDCSEASASGGPFPQIDASEFTYEVLVYERKPDGESRQNYRCQAEISQQWLADLKPSTEYFVKLRALLEERGLNGEPSTPIGFKTKPTHPDKPLPPRLGQRMKTSLLFKWVPPCENGSRIISYHLEIEEASGTANRDARPSDGFFREVYAGQNKQFKIQRLQPSTLYRVRLAASNQHGKSEYSDVLLVQTSGAAPQAPEPPRLIQATSHSLTLEWLRRDGDEDFQLLMEDPLTGHGFLPVCVTQDVAYVVPSLQKHKEYRFRLCASNEDGISQPSEVVTFRTLPGKPQAPSKPSAKGKVNPTSAKIAWDPPRDTGGGDIIGYRLEMDDGNGWSEVYNGSDREHTLNGLHPGVVYRFRLACTSLGGQSSFSDTLSVTTPCVAPGTCNPPTVHGKPRQTSVHLKWLPPESTGGSEITEYDVCMESADVPFSLHSPHIVYSGQKPDCVVNGLSPGQQYAFRVRAHNKAGCAHWSDSCESSTAAAAPDPPQNLCWASTSFNCVHLRWESPQRCNGSPISEYRLQQASRKTVCLQVPQLLPINSTVLNDEGSSNLPCSPTSGAENNSAGVGTTAVLASSAASTTSSLSSGSSANGSPTASTPGGFLELEFGPFVQIFAGCQQAFEARGLIPANDYAFRVQAVNNAGVSKFSSVFVVRTPPGPPDAPLNLCAETISTDKISVYWDAPCDNGSALIGYSLDIQPVPVELSIPIQLPAHCAQYLVENLKPETTYRFRVQSSNDVGAGPHSPAVKATTYSLPPLPPVLELLSASYNSLKLKWSEPCRSPSASPSSSSGAGSLGGGGGASSGEPFTYTVEMENKSGAFSPVYEGNGRSCKVPRLSEFTNYRFRLRAATSTSGVGPWSELYSFKTTRAPPPAVKFPPKVVEVNNTTYQIEWQPVKMPLNVGEKLFYAVQLFSSNRLNLLGTNLISTAEDFKTIYKGTSTSHTVSGLCSGASYRVRINTIRVSPGDSSTDADLIETPGSPSPVSTFSLMSSTNAQQRICDLNDLSLKSASDLVDQPSRGWTDRQWAVLILIGFSVVTIFIAILLHSFVAS